MRDGGDRGAEDGLPASPPGSASLTSSRTTTSSVASDLSQTDGLSAYADYLPAIDRLCTAYVVRAFERLGARFVPGATLAPVPTAFRFARLMPRLWRMLEEDGIVGHDRRVLRNSAA